jgi:hypothetical protein
MLLRSERGAAARAFPDLQAPALALRSAQAMVLACRVSLTNWL